MNCPLCGNEGNLCESHVVPEFLFKPAYDTSHRLKFFNRGSSGSRIFQKGFHSKLLCLSCEKILNEKYEQPMSKIWKRVIPDKPPSNIFLCQDIDFNLLKLFHLSILWRASVCKHENYSHVSLGNFHEIQIKNLILEGNPVPANKCPIFGEIITIRGTGKAMKGFVTSFSPKRVNGHRCYPFFYGGCVWQTFVSSHPIGSIDEKFIGFTNKLQFKVKNLKDSHLLANTMTEVVRQDQML